MKVGTVLILIALLASIMFPCPCNISSPGKRIFLSSHRACDASGSALSVHADMPFVDAGPYEFIIPPSASFYEMLTPFFKSSYFAFQKERPPRIRAC
jgi:hypothetical protein